MTEPLYRLTEDKIKEIRHVIETLGQADPGLKILKRNGSIHIFNLSGWLQICMRGRKFTRDYISKLLDCGIPYRGSSFEYIEDFILAIKELIQQTDDKPSVHVNGTRRGILNDFINSKFSKDWCELVKASPNSQYSRNNNQSRVPRAQRSNKSYKISQGLLSVDYLHQEASCKTTVGRLMPASALLCGTPDDRIQRWIVKRLVTCLEMCHSSFKNARKAEFFAPSHQMGINFNSFWDDLAEQLGVKSFGESSIIQDICELLNTTSIVIAVYGIDRLSRESQKLLIQSFWSQVCQRLILARNQLSQRRIRVKSRLILLLTENGNEQQRPYAVANAGQTEEPGIPVLLAPLTDISLADIDTWLDKPDIIELIKNTGQTTDAVYDLLEQRQVQSDPASILNELCYVLKLERGLSEVEEHWRLAG